MHLLAGEAGCPDGVRLPLRGGYQASRELQAGSPSQAQGTSEARTWLGFKSRGGMSPVLCRENPATERSEAGFVGFSFASCDLYRSSSPEPSRPISRYNSLHPDPYPPGAQPGLRAARKCRGLKAGAGARPARQQGHEESRSARGDLSSNRRALEVILGR